MSGVDTLPSYGDFDADGRADLAVFAIDDVSLTVDVTTASGTVQHAFPPITGYTVLPGPTGDFNGDGRTDLSIEQATQESFRATASTPSGWRCRRAPASKTHRGGCRTAPNPSRPSPISTATVTTTPSRD